MAANWKVWVHLPEGDFGEWLNMTVTRTNPIRRFHLAHNGERFSASAEMIRIRKAGVPDNVLRHAESLAKELL